MSENKREITKPESEVTEIEDNNNKDLSKIRRVGLSIRQSSYQGPLPPAEDLAKYKEVDTSFPSRIFDMAEEEAKHRRSLQLKKFQSDSLARILGLGAGFIICLAFMIVSYLLIASGHDIAGTIFGTADLISLASIFIYSYSSRNNDRIEKLRALSKQLKQGNEDENKN